MTVLHHDKQDVLKLYYDMTKNMYDLALLYIEYGQIDAALYMLKHVYKTAQEYQRSNADWKWLMDNSELSIKRIKALQ